MKKLRLIVVSVVLAFPIIGAVASPANACVDTTDLDGCGKINYICSKTITKGHNCVG